MAWLDRQSFLGAHSDTILSQLKVGLAGLGGGNSHCAQQLAHMGVGHYVLCDDDSIEDTNLNRLVGGTASDVNAGTFKTEIAERTIRAINPGARISTYIAKWQIASEELKSCDIIIGGLDSMNAKAELEGFCRRFLIPYLDLGMDVHQLEAPHGFLVAGQVALSMPGHQCLRCMRIVTDDGLTQEAKRYGDAGGKPQVVWPNGILASSAVGILAQLFTPWCPPPKGSLHLVYDANTGLITEDEQFRRRRGFPCSHYDAKAVGDPSFDIRVLPAPEAPSESIAAEAVIPPTLLNGILHWFSTACSQILPTLKNIVIKIKEQNSWLK